MLALRPLLLDWGQATHVEPDMADEEPWLHLGQPTVYQIVVRGELTEDWSRWYERFPGHIGSVLDVCTVVPPDVAALLGPPPNPLGKLGRHRGNRKRSISCLEAG